MREDLTIIRSDAPSKILTAFEERMPARQTSIQKRASVEEETFISLAEATERGFKKLAFDLYENPDYGSLWKLEDIDGEPWLVVYTDEDDNIIRKVANLLRSSQFFEAQWKEGDIVERGPDKRGEIQNVRYLRAGPEYLVDFGLGEAEWVPEVDLSSPIDVESFIDNRRLGEVIHRLSKHGQIEEWEKSWEEAEWPGKKDEDVQMGDLLWYATMEAVEQGEISPDTSFEEYVTFLSDTWGEDLRDEHWVVPGLFHSLQKGFSPTQWETRAPEEMRRTEGVFGSIGTRVVAEVAKRMKTAQNPPMAPSEDVTPMAFNVRTDEEELSDPEIKQYFEEKEKKEKEEEPKVEVKTEPAGVGGKVETLEMKFPDRVRHIKIDLDGEEGEEEEEEEEETGLPKVTPPPTGTAQLPEGIPGPGLGGEVPVSF